MRVCLRNRSQTIRLLPQQLTNHFPTQCVTISKRYEFKKRESNLELGIRGGERTAKIAGKRLSYWLGYFIEGSFLPSKDLWITFSTREEAEIFMSLHFIIFRRTTRQSVEVQTSEFRF